MLKIGYKNIKLGRLRFDEGGIEKPQNFFDVATEWQVVSHFYADFSLGVDDEDTTQGETGIFEEYVVSARDVLLDISEQWVVDWST